MSRKTVADFLKHPIVASLILACVYGAWRAWRPDQGPPVSEVGWGVAIFAASLVAIAQIQAIYAESMKARRFRQRVGALQTELSRWFLERKRGEPRPWTMSPDDDRNVQMRQYEAHFRETVAEYIARYHPRFLAIYDECKRRGYADDELDRSPYQTIVQPMQIDEIVTRLGVIEQRLLEKW